MEWEEIVDVKERLIALPLADRKDGNNRIIGSATWILPGLFITAKHLLEEYVKVHEGLDIARHDWEPQDMELGFEIDVLVPLKSGVVSWHINKVHLLKNCDLAVLVALSYDGDGHELIERQFKVNIDLHMPALNSNVLALGYPNVVNKVVNLDKKITHHRLQLTQAPGIVEAIDQSYNNPDMLPRIQTNAVIDGGMSGGPVFNEKGHLIAVVQSGLTPTDDFPFYSSILVPLLPAVVCPVMLPLETNKNQFSKTSLLELARSHTIQIKGLEHITFNGEGSYTWDNKNQKCEHCL